MNGCTTALRGLLLFSLFPGVPLVCEAATLSGNAQDAQGKPVASLIVFIVDRQTNNRIPVATNQKGNFTAELPKGHYVVYAEQENRTTFLVFLSLDSKERRHLRIQVTEKGVRAMELTAPREETGAPDPPIEADPSLATIRDYRVQETEPARTNVPGPRSIAEIVNPFSAKRIGRFHGSLYEFLRNDNFDARNFFDPVGEPLPEYKRNQFGVTFGALLSSKLNLLGTYEGLRIIQGSTLVSHVPDPAMKRGDFSALATQLRDPVSGLPLEANRIPESRIHPVAKRLLHLIPDPNQPDPDRNYVNNKPVVRNRDSFSLRFDSQLSDASKIFVRYELSDADDSSANFLPAFGSIRKGRDQAASVSFTRKLTNRLLGSLRLDFSRNEDVLRSVNAGKADLLGSLGISGLSVADPQDEGYPDFRFSGYASFGDAVFPITGVNNRMSWDVALTYAPEDHSIRIGGGFAAHQTNNNRSDGLRKGRFAFDGYYSGDAFADFLFGFPDTASRGVGSDRADLRRKSWYLFVSDEWKISPNLSLNTGLSYNYASPYRSVGNNVSGFFPLLFEPPLDGEIVIAGSERAHQLGLNGAGKGGLVFPDRNDWGPSLGFAYSPFGRNRLVLRSSYSTFYSPVGAGFFVNNLARNFPFYFVETAQSSVDRAGLNLATPFESNVAAELGVRGIDPHLRTPYIQSWHLIAQNESFQHWNFSASYQGSKGTHIAQILAANVPLPGPGDIQPRRPNPNFGRFAILTASGSYTAHALRLSAERRLVEGLALKSEFAWNRTLNDLYRSFPSNPRNLRAERGPADSIPARELFLSYIFDLPFGKDGKFSRDSPGWVQKIAGGWRLSGITRVQTGAPYNVLLPGDPGNDGVASDRPDRLGPGTLDPSKRSVNQWFAVSDFAAPQAYAFGNSGRNILAGPRYHNWDVSVIRQARLSNGHLFEFRLELFNAFNHVNFEQPYAVFGTSLFGKIFGARRAREIEVALRYSF